MRNFSEFHVSFGSGAESIEYGSLINVAQRRRLSGEELIDKIPTDGLALPEGLSVRRTVFP